MASKMTLQDMTLRKYHDLLHKSQKKLNDHKDSKFLERPTEDELTDISGKLIRMQEVKSDVKISYKDEEKKLMLYQYLMQDPSTWPTQKDIEETGNDYKKIADQCNHLKEKIDDEKQQIEEIVDLGENGLGLLQKNIDDLEKKTNELQKKIIRAENVVKNYKEKMSVFGKDMVDGASINDIKENKKEQIIQLEKEIEKGRLSEERMLKQIKDYQDIVKRMNVVLDKERDTRTKKDKDIQIQSFQTQQEMAKLKVLLEEMHRLSGIEVCFANDEQMRVKFANISQPESCLFLTLRFCKDNSSHIRLSHAEVNIETFHCLDLIEDAIRTNDIRGLITILQDRWNMYYPIMSEIDTVSESHAVDWIQDEGLVRILVGKGGTVMYTLKMPPGYPFEGEITVAKTSGLPNELSEEDCVSQSGKATLKEWVDFLEEKFGKP